MKNSIIKVLPDHFVAGKKCYSRKALANTLNKSIHTVAGWKTRGIGPSFVKIGRDVFYPEAEVQRWLNDQMVKENDNLRAKLELTEGHFTDYAEEQSDLREQDAGRWKKYKRRADALDRRMAEAVIQLRVAVQDIES